MERVWYEAEGVVDESGAAREMLVTEHIPLARILELAVPWPSDAVVELGPEAVLV